MAHKYNIELPIDLKRAHNIDAKNKNIFWRDGIDFKICNNGVTF